MNNEAYCVKVELRKVFSDEQITYNYMFIHLLFAIFLPKRQWRDLPKI